MKFMRNFAAVTAMAIALFAFSSCDSSGNEPKMSDATSAMPSASTSANQTSSEKVNLTIYNWHEEREAAYKETIAEYNKKNPQVNAVYEAKSYDQYYSLLSTAIQAGEAPDLFTSHGSKTMYLSQFVKSNACLQLDGLIDTSGYPDNCIKRAQIDGKLYMSPASFYDTICVYYNKDIFNQYALKEPGTYDEFINICDTLVKNGVQPIVVAGKTGWSQINDLVSIITELAPDWSVDFIYGKAKLSDPRFIDAYKTYISFADKGYFGDNYQATDENGSCVFFQAGKAAMYIAGSWMISSLTESKDLKVDCFYLPTKDGKKLTPYAEDTCTGYSVYADSKNKNEAIALLKFFMEPAALDKIAKIGFSVPALNSVTVEHPLLVKMAQIDTPAELWNDAFTVYSKDGYNALDDLVSLSQKLLYEQMTLDEFISQMESELDYTKGQ